MRKRAVYSVFIAFVLVFLVVRFTGLRDYLTFAGIKELRFTVKHFVGIHYALSALVYIFIYIVVTGLSVPGASALTILGGFAFGALPGAFYVNIGATAGSLVIFSFSRYLLGNVLQEKYSEKLKRLNSDIKENGANYLLTLRFIPLFPFWMINILAGLTSIPLKTFVWTTSVGIIPGSLMYTFAGSRLNYINSTKDIFKGNVLVLFILLPAFFLLPVILKKLKLVNIR